MQTINTHLMRPKNSTTMSKPLMSAPEKSWFQMKATSETSADIYIYDEIGMWGISARRFTEDLISLGNINHINLHIHSPGGEVFEGIAIYNQLKNHNATITVYIDGLAASMASVIAMVGDEIIMPTNAMMMIHKPWGVSWGDANDMRDYADLLDKVENVLIPAYMEKTGKTKEEIEAMLGEETWLTAEECVEHGFANTVIEPVKAMASLSSKRIEEFKSMPNSLKNTLKNSLANPRNTTTPSAPVAEPAPQSQNPTNTQQPDTASIQAQARQAEQTRMNDIKDLFAMFGGKHDSVMVECLTDINCTVEQAKDKILDLVAKEATPTNKNNYGAHIYANNGNIVGDSVRASLMARAGYDETQADNPYNCMTLRELARMSLADRGVGVASYNPMQMIAMAFTHTTSDFGNILLDVANKSILQGWNEAEETFDLWTKKGQLSDFKTATRVGMGGFNSLRTVREGAEYKYVTTSDKKETIALATYGELFSISRQAIINDDMSMLTDIPMKLGRAAKATIGDLVYVILTKNEKMRSDNKPLFSADHGNTIKGGMDVDTIGNGRTAMRKQKEGERTLNIRPAFMLVPTALEIAAIQVVGSGSVKGADVNANIINPIRNIAEIITEPRLDINSDTTWYMTSAKGTDTIEVAYLNGVDTPYIDQQEGFTSDGVTTKVRIDAGVAPVDYRGLVRVEAA
ncbi:ClpP-like prohead protease/major capsid protein fusion protein [Providencia rettgeri]|uniref:ClpP-like prohead protease/major capsid protein fusion protein n=1 Tax=Providencia TaxID=586 RepID=UPI0013E18F37|nr:Clp protease ClpP [Providencia sp. 1701011]QIF60564.1 Clp protease ClpP [Providencia sp. 1701091]